MPNAEKKENFTLKNALNKIYESLIMIGDMSS